MLTLHLSEQIQHTHCIKGIHYKRKAKSAEACVCVFITSTAAEVFSTENIVAQLLDRLKACRAGRQAGKLGCGLTGGCGVLPATDVYMSA